MTPDYIQFRLLPPEATLARRDDPVIARMREELGVRQVRDAAVLIPLLSRPQGLSVLFTRRSDDLPSHAGQISFPGGKIEQDDASPAAAALREAQEEVGLRPSGVRLLGQLERVETPSGFSIQPFVGHVLREEGLNDQSPEVSQLFDAPLAFLLDPANHRQETRSFGGVMRQITLIPFGTHVIWGATASMLLALGRALA